MRRIIQLARIGAFVAFMILPVGCLIALGAVAPYAHPFTTFPQIGMIVHDIAARADLAAALFERSTLTKQAIRAQSALFYYGFGYVDTPLVISGIDGWLFHKEDFWGGRCLPAGFFAGRLAYADALQDVAEAAGIRLLISVSPDKSFIYPEKLDPRARFYWRCKAENGALWRQIAKENAPRIVDHAEPILARKRIEPGDQLYLVTDTHWLALAAALAERQLVAALSSRTAARTLAPRVSGQFLTVDTDLRNVMLVLDEKERVPGIDPTIESAFANAATVNLDLGTTTVLHDSFYLSQRELFGAVLPAAQFISLSRGNDTYAAALHDSKTIIANSIERSFFARLDGTFSWSGGLGTAILARNQETAKRCDSFRPLRMGSDPASIAVSIPATATGDQPCLTLVVTTKAPGTAEIFLPTKHGSAEFQAGRSIRVPLAAGTEEVRLVLPAYVSSRRVKVALTGGVVSTIEAGVLRGP